MNAPKHHTIQLDAAEFDAVLAALRCYQQVLSQCAGDIPDDLDDIATNGGEHARLDMEELDEFCERLNAGDPPAAEAEARWRELCNAQGWNEASRVALQEGFIRDHGLMTALVAYCQEAADKARA